VRATLIEQMTYEEYMRFLTNPTLIYIVGMAPLSGQTVVEINLSIARAILDRLLGSSGLLSPRQIEMTEIELGLLERIGELLQGSLKESWHNVLDLDVTMQEPVFAPGFVQVTLPGESTAMVVLEVSMMSVTGTMGLCLPHPLTLALWPPWTCSAMSQSRSA
jgi:flagellar motor switch protein FliM